MCAGGENNPQKPRPRAVGFVGLAGQDGWVCGVCCAANRGKPSARLQSAAGGLFCERDFYNKNSPFRLVVTDFEGAVVKLQGVLYGHLAEAMLLALRLFCG